MHTEQQKKIKNIMCKLYESAVEQSIQQFFCNFAYSVNKLCLGTGK